ncbi:SET and MYND domain-containing protein 4-like isoform X1 [Trichogramma pretiosum]|uniref:SET and MYND domain-containing protein 4-like isoform X1 n=1 Tax=Trichogramma pretiosum TaxID=7493 RepID=UPI0006C9B7A6|nr:SET and MYND domain-containing protein 4-like isoform X1 [Trichogramma pretiosum]
MTLTMSTEDNYFEQMIQYYFTVDDVKNLLETQHENESKCSDWAKILRLEGTQKFLDKKCHDDAVHAQIWDCYARSKLYAPPNSESLALSYCNQSAFLFHTCKYKECIEDIDRALKITNSNELKFKLLCRKARCLAYLGKEDKYDVFNKAKLLINKSNETYFKRKKFTQCLKKVERIFQKFAYKEVDHKVIWSNKSNGELSYSPDQLTTDMKNLYTPKKSKICHYTDNSHRDILYEKESEGLFTSVRVENNAQQGQHLVASRYIQPGELVIVSKPTITVPSFKKPANFCDHCLGVAWAGIPCNDCTHVIYCSDKCKIEAEKLYHDVECNLIDKIVDGNSFYNYLIHLSIRIVIAGVKEFKSIENLKKAVEKIDYNKAQNNSFDDAEFPYSSIVSLLAYACNQVSEEATAYLAHESCRSVILLAKMKDFLGKNIGFDSIEDFTKNHDAVFIGSLIFRIALITHDYGIKVIEQEGRCPENAGNACLSPTPCCERGYSINGLARLIPHSCNPNVRSMKTGPGREIWYAILPIEEGEPLVETYGTAFFELALEHRRPGRDCGCVACHEEWPPVLTEANTDEVAEFYAYVFRQVLDSCETRAKRHKLVRLIRKFGLVHQRIIEELKSIVEAAYYYYVQPSACISAGVFLMIYVFNKLYGLRMILPHKCRKVDRESSGTL